MHIADPQENIQLSVITVVYNEKDRIRRTIESVTINKPSGLEYIIIDGGSTDGTLDVVSELRDKIDLIISGEDEGIYDAMNIGVEYARGEYICMLNSGDWFIDGVLPEVLARLNGSNAFLGRCFYHKIRDGVIQQDRLSMPSKHTYEFCHQAFFYPRKWHMRYGVYDKKFKYSADYDFFSKLKNNGINIFKIDMFVVNRGKYGDDSSEKFGALWDSVVIDWNNSVLRFTLFRRILNLFKFLIKKGINSFGY